MQEKNELRRQMRAKRADFVSSIPDGVRSLILNRPPAQVVDALVGCQTIGLYHATANEAPGHGWARWFHENGRQIALPRFSARDAEMEFRRWTDPWNEDSLEIGPFGTAQPATEAEMIIPDALVVPLLAFTPGCLRLGQGGGHYDRWLERHPPRLAVGLAWDVQCLDDLPVEDHDCPLDAVVTPTRIYWKMPDAH